MVRTIRDEDSGNERTVSINDVRAIRKYENPKTGAVSMLCGIPDYGEMWIPYSQIHDDSEVYIEGHVGKLVITRWIAEQKGLA